MEDDFEWMDSINPLEDVREYKIWLGDTTVENQNRVLLLLYDIGISIGVYRRPSRPSTVEDLGHSGVILTMIMFKKSSRRDKFIFSGWMGAQLGNSGSDKGWYIDDDGTTRITKDKLLHDHIYYNERVDGVELSPESLVGFIKK